MSILVRDNGTSRLVKVKNGHYSLLWQGDRIEIVRERNPDRWQVVLTPGEDWRLRELKATVRTLEEAKHWVECGWGRELVMTRNILNPAAGEFPIERRLMGGCCDPGTETYHCM